MAEDSRILGKSIESDPIDSLIALEQYDAVFSLCQSTAPINDADYPIANRIHPHAAATAYFNSRSIILEPNVSRKITLLEGSLHGSLIPDEKFPESVFIYQPDEGYLGADQMVFLVEVKGKTFKVIYSVDVIHNPDFGSPGCPDGFSINELTNSTNGGDKKAPSTS